MSISVMFPFLCTSLYTHSYIYIYIKLAVCVWVCATATQVFKWLSRCIGVIHVKIY